ncbi:hypothetical protein L0U85_03700 [Glycomyces sp. L485]|uniref:hypothetical protein n=1 Tax=Glycomyces sp. L485 TaxID=2909235 RepID=UPI001F4A14CD|nr:hypothetical protein [Glycomyces sp. L485]MCH7229966.1 hypothetical protein [Glycomyces sp. L485]
MTTIPKALAIWFPLVPRARPICAPLEQRISDVTSMAHGAATATEAAAALNLTTLIASDIGAQGIAADMCWRQFHAFAKRAPLDTMTAGLAMEPIINLARLAVREGDGDRAHQILDRTLTAANDATSVAIDSDTVDFADLTPETESRHAARERLWIAMLSDGTRALTRAGRWAEALQALQRHNGIGDRLLDGRQTAIITRYITGDLTSAITMIADTAAIDPWEQVLAAYLETCCAILSGTANATSCSRLVQQYLQLELPTEQQLFQIRLGLSTLELAHFTRADTDMLVKKLGHVALEVKDAYAARDLMSNQHFVLLGQSEALADLRTLLSESGLGFNAASNLQRQRLNVAFDVGLTRLCSLIAEPAPTQ